MLNDMVVEAVADMHRGTKRVAAEEAEVHTSIMAIPPAKQQRGEADFCPATPFGSLNESPMESAVSCWQPSAPWLEIKWPQDYL